jgi:hypothetical protein
MAKHYSKRASKKRAHKKRRTVRKVRNTIRRKIQVGGIDGTTPIILMIIAGPFIALIGLDRIMLFLNILLILLGQQPMRGGGGFFNALKANAIAGFDTVKDKAKASGFAPILHSIKGAAPDQLNNFTGKLRSITEYGPTAPSGSSLKTRLIDKLTELKIKLDAEPAMYDKASACLQKIIEKLQNGSINIDKPTQTPVVVEPVGNISDILKNAITAASVSEDSSVLDRIRSKFTIGLGVLKTELTAKIDRLLERIYSKYGLDADVIQCFTTLKTTLLDAIIKKKDEAISKVMNDDKVKQAIVKYEAMKERAGSALGGLKTGLTGIMGKSSPVAPPDTAVPSDAEIRDLEYKATTSKALADAKKREAVEAADKLKMATPAVNTMPTKEQRNAYDNLQRNARTKNTAAAAAAVIAESALQEAKSAKAAAAAAAAAATATPASRLSMFNQFKLFN